MSTYSWEVFCRSTQSTLASGESLSLKSAQESALAAASNQDWGRVTVTVEDIETGRAWEFLHDSPHFRFEPIGGRWEVLQ